jgi:hypothetical protein
MHDKRSSGFTMLNCQPHFRAGSNKVPVIAAILILAALSNIEATWALEDLPVAQIVGVQAPSSVLPNEDFDVAVAVDYSERYSTDIAILDRATGFVLASKGLIIPSGRNVFTFHLSGREQPGTWVLVATVRVWWHDGWYASEKGATLLFSITVSDPIQITLVLASNVPNSSVTVDGISHQLIPDGIEVSTRRGFHTIEIEPSSVKDPGTRVVFDHWSDGTSASSRRIYLIDSLRLSAIYLTEYSLSVESSVGQTVGSGWYSAGANATFAVIDSGLNGQQPSSHNSHRFTHWSGDSNSTSNVEWVLMDRPKFVVANWVEDNSSAMLTSEFAIGSITCLACSAVIVAATVSLSRRKRDGRRGDSPPKRMRTQAPLLVLIFILAVGHSPVMQSAQASVPVQPESVTIGDATWYHWNQVASDTLLIWLGGGTVGEATFLVNPYEFESYNTIRFIQDLAEHYDVLALEKGSLRTLDSALNRTIFREPYPGSYDFVKKIRSWAHEEGYVYLYVVGYSVGAMVAARELAVVSPEDWTSPDGLIIITTKIPSSEAESLHASLLMLYGDRIAPEFTASGKAFFGNAPEEGWRDGSWYHREYHVIPDVEHEVWTIMDSGEYDSRATLITIKFIETCKSLQFEPLIGPISEAAINHTTKTPTGTRSNATIVSVSSPSRTATREAFRVTAWLAYDLPSNSTVALLAFDKDARSLVSAAKKQSSGNGEVYLVDTVLSGEAPRTVHLSLIALFQVGGNWSIAANGLRDLSTEVTDSFSTRVITGYPNTPVEFDDHTFSTGPSGEITLNVSPGEHRLSVPPVITIGDIKRAVFEEWNATPASSTMQLVISRDVCLVAVYREQYYLNVTSPLGQTSGAGWHDANSTAIVQVAPTIVTDKLIHVFVGWLGDSSSSSPSAIVFVDGPKKVEASWEDIKSPENGVNIPMPQTFFVASLAILLASIAFAVRSLPHRRKPPSTGTPSRLTQEQSCEANASCCNCVPC